MSLLQTLSSVFTRDATKLTFYEVPADHAFTRDPSDPPSLKQVPVEPIVAGESYFRLSLAEMFLRHNVEWFRTWYPAVHSVVKLNFGNMTQVDIPNIVDAGRAGLEKANSGDITIRDYRLTPALPFRGGVVTLTAGLMAVQGRDYMDDFIKVLGSFAQLLAAPQLSSALSVAGPLASGIQNLFGGAGGGNLHLGISKTYAAATPGDSFRGGYWVAIRAPQGSVDTGKLWLVGGQLQQGNSPEDSIAYTEHDHLVLQIETFAHRDDFDSLTALSEPFQEAIKALQESDPQKAQEQLRLALLGAFRAPELTELDRAFVIQKLKERYQKVKDLFDGALGFGDRSGEDSNPEDLKSLNTLGQEAPGSADLRALPTPLLEDILDPAAF